MWEGWTNNPRSRDHYFLVAIDEWFYGTIAGIENTGVAYSTFAIRPYVTGPLTQAQGRVDTIRGPISSSWQIAAGRLNLTVEIPVGSVAEVFVPGEDPGRVEVESALPGPQFQVARVEAGRVVFEVGAGRWTFHAAAPL